MAAKTLTLEGKKFVILPEREYRMLRNEASRKRPAKPPKAPRRGLHRMTAQDRGDVAEAKRMLAAIEAGEDKLIPYEQVRSELKLT